MPIPKTKLYLSATPAIDSGYLLLTEPSTALNSNLNDIPVTGNLAGGLLTAAGTPITATLIGAPGDSDKAVDAGRVFITLDGTPGTRTPLGKSAHELILDGVAAGDAAGTAVALIKDLNGDGIAEFLVGAPGVDVGTTADAGRTYVVWGETAAGGIDLGDAVGGNGAGFAIDGENTGDYSGSAVAALGDVNGDGRSDILVAATGNDAGGLDAGAAYVVWGKGSKTDINLASVAAGTGGFKIIGESAADAAGTAISKIGDINGDGRADLLVSAPGNDAGGLDAGAVYVVFGKGTGAAINLSSVAAGSGGFKIIGIEGSQAGQSIAALGDINADGLSDILIGANNNAYVVFGKSANTTTVDLASVAGGNGGFVITPEQAGDLVGMSVAGGADLNNDGINDLVIGTPSNSEGGTNAGAVYVVWGGSSGPVDLSLIEQGMGGAKIVGLAGSLTGRAVAIAGDLNADGRADLVISSPGNGSVMHLFTPTALWQPDNNVYGTNAADVMDTGYGGTHKIGAGDDNIVAAGGDDTVSAGAGNDVLDGGTGIDRLSGGTGNDTYYVDNAADQVIELAGAGNDTIISSVSYSLAADTEVETLVLAGNGLQGVGNAFANTLIGSSGNDTLNGGGGADTLRGGAGNDIYIVNEAGVLIDEAAGDGLDVVYASVDLTLASNIENLVLTGTTGLHGTGNALGNRITGTSADDQLDGGSGADTLLGGAGNDRYIVDNIGDVISEGINEGDDTVLASVNFTLSDNVENLTLSGTAASATGNSLANTLRAGSVAATLNGGAGNDTLIGSAFADTLNGGSGSNILEGGKGDDTYVVSSQTDRIIELAEGGNDSVLASVDYALSADTSIENLSLTGTARSATGNAADNIIIGNALDNTLDGGSGNDRLQGGAGNDSYFIDAAGDVVVELAGEGNDSVIASIDYTLASGVENLQLTGSAHIGAGNELDNRLVGQAGSDILSGGIGNDILDGSTGADTLIGGLGNDTYYVDDLNDIVIENADEGFDTVVVSSNWTLADNIEAVKLNGSGHMLQGNAANNTLMGDAGNDTLNGGEGDDLELGGDGNDRLISAAGHDTLVGGAGDDVYVLKGGSVSIEDFQGHDTIDASEATGNSYLDLSGTTRSQVGGQSCDFSSGGTVSSALNVQFLQDLTGSFADDIATVQGLIPQIVGALQAIQPSSQFGVSTFRDKPVSPFGGTGDWVYETVKTLSSDASALTSAYNGMVAANGADEPESQIEALMQLALRAGTEVGLQNNAARFVVLFTDASYHKAGDGSAAGILTPNNGDAILDGGGTGEDYPLVSQLKAALIAANIIPIFAIAGGLEPTYQDLVTQLGRGTVVTLSANSANVVAAISNGLTSATTTHIADAIGGAGNDTLIGNVGDNHLSGGLGNDRLDGAGGNNRLDGGEGQDTALYAGKQADYSVNTLTTGETEVSNLVTHATDTLTGIEILSFADGALSLSGAPVNAAPTVTGPIIVTATEDGTPVVRSALANASDSDALTATIDTTLLPAGISYDATTQAFTLDPTHASFQALAAGEPLVMKVDYSITDGTSTVPTSATFTVTGSNDLPVITGDTTAFVIEDERLVAKGQLSAVDPDAAQSGFVAATAAAGLYGTLAITASGAWTYQLNKGDVSVQALARNATLEDAISVHTIDGTEQIIRIAINGIDETAVGSTPRYGTTGDDVIDGTSGDDIIYALDGNDTIRAGDGNDYINGGFGRDSVDAGAGDDFIVVGGGLNGPMRSPSDPVDGGSGYDTVQLEGPASNFRINQISSGGGIVIQATDLSTGQTALFANVETLLFTDGTTLEIAPRNHAPMVSGPVLGRALEGSAIVVLDALANASDSDTRDTLSVVGLPGTLPAGVSYDSAKHSFSIDPSHPDYAVLNTGESLTVRISYGVSDGTDTTAASMELVIDGVGKKTIFGTANADTLLGTVQDDVIDGLAGADRMTGLAGNDTYIVDNTRDVIVEQTNGGTDLVQSSVSHTLAVNVENLTLTGALNINGTGNGVANIITGNAGNNSLVGAAGDDRLFGGAGADNLQGGTGNDLLDGGSGADILNGGAGDDMYIVDQLGDQITDASGFDTIATSLASYKLGAGIESLIYTGSGSFMADGNSLANTIFGGSGADRLNGGAGNDTLNGKAGADLLIGGLGNDRFLLHMGETAGDTISDFEGAGKAVKDQLIFEGYGQGNLSRIGSSDHYVVTADAAHGGGSEELILIGISTLNLSVGSNDYVFI